MAHNGVIAELGESVRPADAPDGARVAVGDPGRLNHILAELDDTEGRVPAAALLVAWLAENGEGHADD